ncbi:MAG: tRNA uridine-5-carboxymethylaminomethyl(34) synthesis GTPase MnmE [Fervidobacterium sp.]
MERDTIVALSSPRGTGAIAVIRLSGEKALEFLKKTLKGDLALKNIKERRTYFANLYDVDGELLDEVIFVYFKSPKSYTGEDMVEIYCHGGVLITDRIINNFIKLGARLAENGEFTKRAFLNGKIDLIKAESILQVIEAKSETSLRLALDNLKGKLSLEIESLRTRIIDILSKIEVSIDYSDDIDVPIDEIFRDLSEVKDYLTEKLKHADRGLHLSTGVTMTIVGKPNVGKSTLLNRLLVEDRAIVTDIPGTTRDVIKGEIKIKGVHFVISDTAGIRQTSDRVEQIGIEKALKEAEKSDIVIFLLDATTGFTENDEYISKIIKNERVLYVWNKVDVGDKIVELGNNVKISAVTGDGIRELEERIIEMVTPLIRDGELSHITSKRQLEYMKKVKLHLDKCINGLKNGLPLDIVSIDLRESLIILDEITGRSFKEDLIDNIFSKFCVGK